MATTTRTRATVTAPKQIPFTGDGEADRLLAEDPLALLIGFVLDQQVTVQKAFSGPLEIRRRLGTLDARQLAEMDPQKLRDAFLERPAIHRFPAAMADRVQALSALIVDEYGGDAGALWRGAGDAKELQRRIASLPGFGPMKAGTVLRLLTHQFGLRPKGYEALLPDHPTLGDVTTADELAEYQARKRAHKAEMRAQGLMPRRKPGNSKGRSR
jgi:uncharacterized HhH-GPD family protein